MPRKNRQFEPKNATPGLDRRRPATNGSALQGSSENRYHSPEAQGSSGRSRLITLTFCLSTPGVAEVTAAVFRRSRQHWASSFLKTLFGRLQCLAQRSEA